VVSSKIWIVGVPMLIALFLLRPNPLLIIVAILAIPKAWAAFRGKLPATGPQLTSTALKARYIAEYLGLACFWGLWQSRCTSKYRHADSGGCVRLELPVVSYRVADVREGSFTRADAPVQLGNNRFAGVKRLVRKNVVYRGPDRGNIHSH
jgi:hypothetical protein